MNKGGAIVIIEGDPDDQKFFKAVLEELHYKNEIIFFNDRQEAYK